MMTNDEAVAAAIEVAETLQGTAMSLEDGIDQTLDINIDDPWSDLPSAFFHELDQQVMCCDCCGWWCPTKEMDTDDGQVCEDCRS